jgi:hypothetical protein
MAGPAQPNALNGKFLTNEVVQIDSGNDDVSAQHACGLTPNAEVLHQAFENFGREKGDLSLVIVPVIVKAIAADSVAGDAIDPRYFDQGIIVRRFAMMSKIVVPRRNEDLPDQHDKLADTEANFADDFRPKPLLQFAQNLRLGDLLKLVMQRGLQHSHRQNPRPQTDRRGVGGDEFPDDLFPGVDYFTFPQPLAQAELLHKLWQQISGRLPAIRAHLVGGQPAPFGNDGSAKGRVHEESKS